VAGATRGAGRAIAVELARSGFYVYATGRSSRTAGPSEIGRPETIEETGDLIAAAGGTGGALVVDHENPAAVAELVAGIEREKGRLDLLVNDIFGGDRYMEWEKPLWEHEWAGGLRMLQMGVHTHLITCRAAIPLILRTAEAQGSQGLVVEMTDGTSAANADFRRNVGFYYDLVKANVERIVKGLTAELEDSPVTAVGVTPGWLRSEKMLENFGVTEANWRDALKERPGSPSRLPMSPEALPPSPRPATLTVGPARSSAHANSLMRTASPTQTAAARTAGATSPPTAGSRTTVSASSGFADSRAACSLLHSALVTFANTGPGHSGLTTPPLSRATSFFMLEICCSFIEAAGRTWDTRYAP
jgi:NAD(P)-dependent dehydrogenase (short-subunit alcohol dehydrogenase family)